MDVDTSEFDAAVPERGNRCWYARMTDDQREKVDAARGKGHSTATVAKVVTAWGYPIKGNVVRVHERGDCSCG